MENRDEKPAAVMRSFRAPNGPDDKVEELLWRCSECSTPRAWGDGRCACGGALSDEAVVKLIPPSRFDPVFWSIQAVNEGAPRLPLTGLRCPFCHDFWLGVRGRPAQREGATGYALDVHCKSCRAVMTAEPDWIQRR